MRPRCQPEQMSNSHLVAVTNRGRAEESRVAAELAMAVATEAMAVMGVMAVTEVATAAQAARAAVAAARPQSTR